MPINYLKQIQLGEYNVEGYRIGPSAGLESVIEGFYVFFRDPKDSAQLIFNDGFPVLVFLQNIEETIKVTGKADSYEVNAAWASAGSIKNVYINYNNSTDQVFIVRFQPSAFYKLFDLTVSYFRDKPVAPFEAIAKNSLFSLIDFFKRDAIEEKIAFFETYVGKALTSQSETVMFNKTLKYIHRIKGIGTVRDVTNNTGVNYKWLERSFKKNIGLLPKEYIQLQRFIHAYQELVGSVDVDLMRIAVSSGYYDANHFLKDFKVYTGKTPIEYLKFSKKTTIKANG
jgi:AraC-like DNA-binding protein